MPPQLDTGSLQLRCHRRPVHAPTAGQERHVVAGLVLGDELLSLLGRQSALDLPWLRGLVSAWSILEQGRQSRG
jgi:hypothetical protein